MARFARLTVLNSMIDVGLVPVFHHENIDTAKSIVAALSRGGARAVEFTNRGDHAFETFSALERYCYAEHPDVILGTGSVIDEITAGTYINLGANFVVGPSLDRRVAEICNRRKVAYSPGCASPTEITFAHELGCEIVKVFPGGLVGGPAFVKAIHGPCPWALLMPTGGVDITNESLTDWFAAGVPCVGIGSKLVSKDLVESGDWATLEQRTADVISTISGLR
jgi:2-dehydro-3-deoxyphosphogluconate aldolase/(4S)-4-hydroxy-2-oxoglutarate aldolase